MKGIRSPVDWGGRIESHQWVCHRVPKLDSASEKWFTLPILIGKGSERASRTKSCWKSQEQKEMITYIFNLIGKKNQGVIIRLSGIYSSQRIGSPSSSVLGKHLDNWWQYWHTPYWEQL